MARYSGTPLPKNLGILTLLAACSAPPPSAEPVPSPPIGVDVPVSEAPPAPPAPPAWMDATWAGTSSKVVVRREGRVDLLDPATASWTPLSCADAISEGGTYAACLRDGRVFVGLLGEEAKDVDLPIAYEPPPPAPLVRRIAWASDTMLYLYQSLDYLAAAEGNAYAGCARYEPANGGWRGIRVCMGEPSLSSLTRGKDGLWENVYATGDPWTVVERYEPGGMPRTVWVQGKDPDAARPVVVVPDPRPLFARDGQVCLTPAGEAAEKCFTPPS